MAEDQSRPHTFDLLFSTIRCFQRGHHDPGSGGRELEAVAPPPQQSLLHGFQIMSPEQDGGARIRDVTEVRGKGSVHLPELLRTDSGGRKSRFKNES